MNDFKRYVYAVFVGISFLGFAAALAGHLYLVAGYSLGSATQSNLFNATLIIFGLMVLLLIGERFEKRGDLGVLLNGLPKVGKVLFLAFTVYVFFNFIYCGFVLLEGGAPSGTEGNYELHNHGQRIRSLTTEQYLTCRHDEVRLISTFWLFLTSLALTFAYALFTKYRYF